MPVLFISHSSRDDALVDALSNWLTANGFSDFFVDHMHIAGGAKWSDELQKSAGACRVVMCLITENWLASLECYSEFLAARYMGKRIFPLLLPLNGAPIDAEAQDRLARVQSEDQGIDVTGWLSPEGGLDISRNEAIAATTRDALRAAGALTKVGLDPEAFEIDREARPTPFPGLSSFGDEDADAAIFYGRSHEIALALEKLRECRAKGDRTPLMILGASGSGKSSLLKAGVIPRLRREAPAWIPLRAFRPGADPLYNFAEAIARTLADFGQREAPGAIRRALIEAWRAAPKESDGTHAEKGWRRVLAALDPIGARLRAAASREKATTLLSIDQAEELARSESESSEALCDLLRATLSPESALDWRLAFTIRSDSLPELLRDPRFEGLDKNGITLRALPVFRFNDVVEAPSRRYGVEIDPLLIDALMEDAPKSDALPLLAFGMQRLWRRFSDSDAIRAEDYRDLGGMSGLIEDAAERALRGLSPDQDKPLPKTPPSSGVLSLAETSFVPALAEVNEEGEAIRRVAPWKEFSKDAQELLGRYDEWRLVVRKSRNGDASTPRAKEGDSIKEVDTIEVAHEALFREWARLRDWLEPERARLDALRGVVVAAAAWDRDGRRPGFLTHFGQRLKVATELEELERYMVRLTDVDLDYVAACTTAERLSSRRRAMQQGMAVVLGVGITLGSLGFAFQFEIAREWIRRMEFLPYSNSTEDLSALSDLATFRECAEDAACPEMVVIPAGRFVMGSPEGEGDGDERPQHEVTIARFAIGRTEVTHEEWLACVNGTDQAALLAQRREDPAAPVVGCVQISDSGFGAGRNPAINLSWYDAAGYARWLNYMVLGDAQSGFYRLPTEQEWEYAARAGTVTTFSWGDTEDGICEHSNLANPDTVSRYDLRGEGFDCRNNSRETSTVGSFQSNAFGLYDMHGNVFEWIQDCWHNSYESAPNNGTAWMETNAGDCSVAVLRGGSWGSYPSSLRSAARSRVGRDVRDNSAGFRLARTLPE